MYALSRRLTFQAPCKTLTVAKPRHCFPSTRPIFFSFIRPFKAVRSLRCNAEGTRPSSKDPVVIDFERLLDEFYEESAPSSWVNAVQRQGQQVAYLVEELRQIISEKTDQLNNIQTRMNELTALWNEAKDRQFSTQTELEVRTQEVDRLKDEIEQLHRARGEDATASMAKYRELEDALAAVESELKSQSESMVSKDASDPVDAAKISEIVREQDIVFQNLKTALKTACEEQEKAEREAIEARTIAEDMERKQTRFQQDYELLSKELSQLQILYAEKELEWMNDVQLVKDDCNKIKEASIGLEMNLATKDRKLETLESALETLKSESEETSTRLAELRREAAELKSVNQMYESQLKNGLKSPEQQDFAQLKTQLTRLQVRVPILEDEIGAFDEVKKQAEGRYDDLEKEMRSYERKCAQLEQRSTVLQLTLEEKSNRLLAAHKEKKTMKSETEKMKRESATLHQRLAQAEKEYERLRMKLRESEEQRKTLRDRFQEEIVRFAERQQEAQKVILYHQEHKNENHALGATIEQLRSEIESRKQELQQTLDSKAHEIECLNKKLNETEEALKGKEIDLMAAVEDKQKLTLKLEQLKTSSKEAQLGKAAEVADLVKELETEKQAMKAAEMEVQNVKKELVKFQNELAQRQRIISVRDQEIVTLKDDARLANERVEALRGQITSMQTLNREMEDERSEMDGIISNLNARLQEKQGEVETTQKAVKEMEKTISDLDTKGKQSLDQFSRQIESLEAYSKQQEGLVESFFEEKQELQKSFDDLKLQLEEQIRKQEDTQTLYESSQKECIELKAMVEKSQLDLKEAKNAAEAEIEKAQKILTKAEKMAHEMDGSPDSKGATQKELLKRVRQLEEKLQSERESARRSAKNADELQHQVLTLKEQMVVLEKPKGPTENGTLSSDVEREIGELKKRLSKSLSAEEAALSEIHRLREQLKAVQSNRVVNTGDVQMLTSDERLSDLRKHAQRLEAENEKLRKAAFKRNQILAQSRHFIEQYLDRSVNSMKDLQS